MAFSELELKLIDRTVGGAVAPPPRASPDGVQVGVVMSSVGDHKGLANHHAATATQEGSCMNKRRLYMILLIIIGVALIALAVYYWVTPAGSLPSFFPGHLAGSAHKHVKHGVLALVVI